MILELQTPPHPQTGWHSYACARPVSVLLQGLAALAAGWPRAFAVFHPDGARGRRVRSEVRMSAPLAPPDPLKAARAALRLGMYTTARELALLDDSIEAIALLVEIDNAEDPELEVPE